MGALARLGFRVLRLEAAFVIAQPLERSLAFARLSRTGESSVLARIPHLPHSRGARCARARIWGRSARCATGGGIIR
jgi:hypothetical protein